MKQFLKSAVGVSPFWELTAAFRRGGCVVLTYHRVGTNRHGFKHISADLFREQMVWLREHCTVIAPAEFRQACRGRDRIRPQVLVTFDDGYRDYHDVASPILRELRIPAVNFIATHFVDHADDLYWWDAVDLAVWASTRERVDVPWRQAPPIALDTAGREWLRMDARRYIKTRPDEECQAILGRLLDAVGVRKSALSADRQVMTWDEIRAVAEHTTIGGHTHNHPLLSQVDDDRLRDELNMCRQRIAAELGAAPSMFAYPSGACTESAKRLVAACGFESAFSCTAGVNDGTVDLLNAKRVNAPAVSRQLPLLLSGLRDRTAA